MTPPTEYPHSYLRDPLHLAAALDQVRDHLTATRLTHGDSTFAPVARLASAHSVLVSLVSEFGDEIVTRADTFDASPLSRRTTAALTAAALNTSCALTQLASAVHDTAGVDERSDLPWSAGDQRRAEWHTHIDYRLHQVTTILGDTARALRRGTEAYSYPYPSVRVQGIEPVPGTILTGVGATHSAAARQRTTAATPVPLPTPCPRRHRHQGQRGRPATYRVNVIDHDRADTLARRVRRREAQRPPCEIPAPIPAVPVRVRWLDTEPPAMLRRRRAGRHRDSGHPFGCDAEDLVPADVPLFGEGSPGRGLRLAPRPGHKVVVHLAVNLIAAA